jgi:hypothetical protein
MDKIRYWVDLAYELFKTYDSVTSTYTKNSVRSSVPRISANDSGATRGKAKNPVRDVDPGFNAGL